MIYLYNERLYVESPLKISFRSTQMSFTWTFTGSEYAIFKSLPSSMDANSAGTFAADTNLPWQYVIWSSFF